MRCGVGLDHDDDDDDEERHERVVEAGKDSGMDILQATSVSAGGSGKKADMKVSICTDTPAGIRYIPKVQYSTGHRSHGGHSQGGWQLGG